MQIEATTSFEFDVDLSGVYERGMRATHDDPGHADTIDDVEVTGLHYGGKDVLAGIDRTNPEIKKLLSNLIDALGDAAEESLWDNV